MADPITIESISAGLRKQVQAVKRNVIDAAKQFAGVREKLSTLAPKVAKLFATIQAENERVTFVDFCRMFDPTVPGHANERNGAEGYRTHRTYYTLDYMRRLARNANNEGRQRGQQGVRDSATDALARTLATVLQVVQDAEPVWLAIQSEFGFSERLLTRLRKRVDETKPLFKLTAPKPLRVGNVVHMTPKAADVTPGGGQGERDAARIVLPAPGEVRAERAAKAGAKRKRAA